jgi:hypothetical protein
VHLTGVHKDAGHWALTRTRPPHVSAAFTNATRFIQRVVNLAPVRKPEAIYSSPRAPRRRPQT